MSFRLILGITILLIVVSTMIYVKGPLSRKSLPSKPISTSMDDPKSLMKSFYPIKGIEVRPSVPEYFPIDPSRISNLDQATEVFALSQDAREKLLEKGFLVTCWYGDDVVSAYKLLAELGVPIYVTSDSMLHLYHVQFDYLLSDIEEKRLLPELIELTNILLEESEEQYSSLEGSLKEAARRNVAYFSVAMRLLNPSYKPPSYVSKEVNEEMELIERHEGFSISPIFGYKEDYSQYVPRGHYTRSEALKRYFKAMMWYGRMAFLIKGGRIIPEEDARRLTMQASLIVAAMQTAKEGKSASEIWSRIYAATSFFVGFADDLTPYEYLQAINEVFDAKFYVENLSNLAMLDELRRKLLKMKKPLIYSGTGKCFAYSMSPEELEECLEESMGMRFMGQRFVPDSYVFQRLVCPSVGLFKGEGTPFTFGYTFLGPTRVFPRGLDFMAVLGSEEALRIIQEEGDSNYERYEENLEKLREEFSSINESEWGRNLYWGWIYALKALIEPRGQGYPSYMRTKAWERRQLYTALASWAELRHDTILYAKQSYTIEVTAVPPSPSTVTVYVEPVPEVYARLSSLVEMTRKGLKELGFLNQTQEERLLMLKEVLDKLVEISKKELEMAPLTSDDLAFLEQIPGELEAIVEDLDERSRSTILVADVHTDQNSGLVLEEGVGRLDLIIVVVPTDEDRLLIAAGPSLSYYEFKQPMSNRLTDEAWKQMLETSPPDRPGWISDFFEPVSVGS